MERPAKLPLPLERNAAMRQRVCKGHHIIGTHSRSKRANISRLVYPRDTHIREKNVLQPSSLLLFCLLFFGTALSSVYHRPILEEGGIEKWDSLMFLHSPALLLTADVEDGRLEIGFNIS
jgi:hypothetical protein